MQFLIDSLIFLGFVESALHIKVDEEKMKSIREWPASTKGQNSGYGGCSDQNATWHAIRYGCGVVV